MSPSVVAAELGRGIVSVSSMKKEIKRLRNNETLYKHKIQKLQFELETFKAVAESYRNKFKSVRTLSMAGITRDDMYMEMADAKLEEGELPSKVRSDVEDDEPQNQVKYSYVELDDFKHEL